MTWLREKPGLQISLSKDVLNLILSIVSVEQGHKQSQSSILLAFCSDTGNKQECPAHTVLLSLVSLRRIKK